MHSSNVFLRCCRGYQNSLVWCSIWLHDRDFTDCSRWNHSRKKKLDPGELPTFLALLDSVSRGHGMGGLVCRPLSIRGIDYLWNYCMDSFQIGVVASPGPSPSTFFEFLKKKTDFPIFSSAWLCQQNSWNRNSSIVRRPCCNYLWA